MRDRVWPMVIVVVAVVVVVVGVVGDELEATEC